MPRKPTPPTAKEPAAVNGLPYKELSARHEDYCAEIWQQLDDFYVGGFQLEKRAADYMPQLVGEHPARYRERTGGTGYINHFGHIVDRISACVFESELTMRPAADADDPKTPGDRPDDETVYTKFASDVDGAGTKLNAFLHKRLKDVLKNKVTVVAVDFPRKPGGVQVESVADEERLGLGRAYAYEVPLNQIIDWDDDDDGGFRYAVIHRRKARKAPPGRRTGTIVEEFKVWEKVEPDEGDESSLDFEPDGEDVDAGAKAVWTMYRIEYPASTPPTPDQIIPIVDAGITTFRRIPLLRMVVDDGLWVGNKLCGLAREHFGRRASLISAENKSLVAIPWVQKGPEMSAVGNAMPSQVQQNPNRVSGGPVASFDSMGFVELGSGDEIGYASPDVSCYALVDKELDSLKDEMHRVVDQMAASVDNSASTTRRSGESKKQDYSAEATVYNALGYVVREFGLLVFRTMSEARGEDIVWGAHGLDDYEKVDRATVLEEAVSLDLVPIPSQIFRRTWKTQVANKLVGDGMAPETRDAMRVEIEKGVTSEESMRLEADDAEHEAKVATLDATKKQAKSPTSNGAFGKPRPFA